MITLKSLAKKIFEFAFIPLLKAVSPIFYDCRYLSGRYFEGVDGWVWVLRSIWFQKILGFNRSLPFPVSPGIRISNYKNLVLGENVINNFQSFGIYYQNFSALIYLGDDCYIGPNVGIITSNHDVEDPKMHLPGKDVVIGAGCWIGMNSVILPGVTLGDGSVVGAGSVVTKSFPEGVVIAGNPAKLVRRVKP